jgi:hypothetical protein
MVDLDDAGVAGEIGGFDADGHPGRGIGGLAQRLRRTWRAYHALRGLRACQPPQRSALASAVRVKAAENAVSQWSRRSNPALTDRVITGLIGLGVVFTGMCHPGNEGAGPIAVSKCGSLLVSGNGDEVKLWNLPRLMKEAPK